MGAYLNDIDFDNGRFSNSANTPVIGYYNRKKPVANLKTITADAVDTSTAEAEIDSGAEPEETNLVRNRL